jgi:hypothetical protein
VFLRAGSQIGHAGINFIQSMLCHPNKEKQHPSKLRQMFSGRFDGTFLCTLIVQDLCLFFANGELKYLRTETLCNAKNIAQGNTSLNGGCKGSNLTEFKRFLQYLIILA